MSARAAARKMSTAVSVTVKGSKQVSHVPAVIDRPGAGVGASPPRPRHLVAAASRAGPAPRRLRLPLPGKGIPGVSHPAAGEVEGAGVRST